MQYEEIKTRLLLLASSERNQKKLDRILAEFTKKKLKVPSLALDNFIFSEEIIKQLDISDIETNREIILEQLNQSLYSIFIQKDNILTCIINQKSYPCINLDIVNDGMIIAGRIIKDYLFDDFEIIKNITLDELQSLVQINDGDEYTAYKIISSIPDEDDEDLLLYMALIANTGEALLDLSEYELTLEKIDFNIWEIIDESGMAIGEIELMGEKIEIVSSSITSLEELVSIYENKGFKLLSKQVKNIADILSE